MSELIKTKTIKIDENKNIFVTFETTKFLKIGDLGVLYLDKKKEIKELIQVVEIETKDGEYLEIKAKLEILPTPLKENTCTNRCFEYIDKGYCNGCHKKIINEDIRMYFDKEISI